MSVQLVVFDMAGTTVYDGDAVHHALQGALQTAGVAATRPQINAVMGIAKPVAIRCLLEDQRSGLAVTEAEVEAIYAEFLDRMLRYYREDPSVTEIPGASALFRQLRKQGVKVALDTGFSRAVADTVMERLHWRVGETIDASVTSDEVAQGRPFPDMLFRAMELTGVTEVKRVAKVGDTPSDLGEGTAAGCGWVIGVTGGSHTHEELAAYPHTHLISSVAELPACFAAAPDVSVRG